MYPLKHNTGTFEFRTKNFIYLFAPLYRQASLVSIHHAFNLFSFLSTEAAQWR